VVGYTLVTGTHVFAEGSLVETCAAHLHSEPEPPSQRLGRPISTDFEQLVLQCLAKDPADRVASVADFPERLEARKDFGRWSPQQARAWWKKYQPTLEPIRDKSPVPRDRRALTIAASPRPSPSIRS
jgi:eukaryotic-like serine/threonine-protein kinase